MASAIITIQMICLASATLAFVAGLYEFGLIGNGRILGLDSLPVMMWAGAITVLTSPIVITLIYPLKDDDSPPDAEETVS